jgi:hypothetical protein
VTQHHTPCGSCPFLKAKAGMLTVARAQELVRCLRGDGHFWCHKTVDYSRGNGVVTSKARLCAGSLIVAHRSGAHPGQLARITERLGMLDMAKIEASDAPVFDTFTEFIREHGRKRPRVPA